jgi:hypothetical protein
MKPPPSFVTSSPVLLLLLFASTANIVYGSEDDALDRLNRPLKILAVRLRTKDDKWGRKLKVSYSLPPNGDYSDHGEVCLSCTFDAEGQRVGDTGELKRGSTCGGFPNGCVAFTGATAFAPGATVTLSLRLHKAQVGPSPPRRVGRQDAAPLVFFPWSTPMTYFADPTLFERPGKHTLQPIAGGGPPAAPAMPAVPGAPATSATTPDGIRRVEALFSSLADADGVVRSAVMLEVLTTLGGDATRIKDEVKELLGAEGRKSSAEIVQGPIGQFLSSRHDEASDKLSQMEVAAAAVVAGRSAPWGAGKNTKDEL